MARGSGGSRRLDGVGVRHQVRTDGLAAWIGDGTVGQSPMDFRILGPLEVSDGGRAVALGGVKHRSLLAILLQLPNAIVSTDHLLAELWGDAPPTSADNSIHVHVSRLRKELGHDRLITRPPGYALRVDASELDLAKFARLRDEGRPHAASRSTRRPASGSPAPTRWSPATWWPSSPGSGTAGSAACASRTSC